MNTRQLYRFLFSNSNANESMPAFFASLKYEYKFRGMLRSLNASTSEKQLYENNRDTVIWDFKIDQVAYFKYLNEKYHYLTDSAENHELYRRIYYICSAIHLKSSFLSHRDNVELHAYQMMVYFGLDKEVETILEKFDLYCSTNNLSGKALSVIFPKDLKEMDNSLQLSAWQKLISDSLSQDSLRFLSIAPEIEKKLGRTPNDIEEVKKIYETLLRDQEWNREELVRFFSVAVSDQTKSSFITSINEKNLNEFVGNHYDFCEIVSALTNAELEKKFIARFSEQKLQALIYSECASSIKDAYLKMLNAVHRENVSYLIKKMGTETLLKDVRSAYDLELFIKHDLPRTYDKSYFLTDVLSSEKIKSYIQYASDIKYLLPLVDYKERVNFLLMTIGKEKCQLLTKEPYYLCAVVDELMLEDRLPFLKEILTPANLEDIRGHHWKELKSKLRVEEDKKALTKLIYSEEELAAKETLKNIKHTIAKTKWAFGMFDNVVSTNMSHGKQVDVPRSIMPQIDELRAVSFGNKTPSEALGEIKKIGQATAKEQTRTGKFKNRFFAKSETEKYFDKFADEETFNKAFVLKR